MYHEALKWNRGALQPDLAAYGTTPYSLRGCLPGCTAGVSGYSGGKSKGSRTGACREHTAYYSGAYPAQVCCGYVCRAAHLWAAQQESRAAQAPNSRVSGASWRWKQCPPCSARSSPNPQRTPAPSPPAAVASAPAGTQRARRNSGKVSFASSAPAEAPTGRGPVP